MLGLCGCGGRSTPEGGRWVVWADLHGEPAVWIARADGSQRRLLVRKAFGPRVSPDGRWVAFIGCVEGSACLHGDEPLNLFVTAARRDGDRRLLARGVFRATWAPTSDRLVGVDADGLVSIRLDSGTVTKLAHGGAFPGWSFSPRGKRLVYAHSVRTLHNLCSEEVDLYTQSLAGGAPRRITDDGRAAFPIWGPGWIAFTRMERSCRIDRELWLVRPDGRDRHRLARLRRGAPGYWGLMAVDWRAGALLGGIATESGDIAVAVNPRTGAYRRIGRGWYATALSHDGKHVLLFRGGAEPPYAIGWVAFRGGREHVLAQGDVGHESWNR